MDAIRVLLAWMHLLEVLQTEFIQQVANTLIKNQCSYCKKSISILPFKCKRCGDIFCEEHRLPEAHECPVKISYEGKWFKDENIIPNVEELERENEKLEEIFLRGGESYSAEDRKKALDKFQYNTASINLIKSKEIEEPVSEIDSLRRQKTLLLEELKNTTDMNKRREILDILSNLDKEIEKLRPTATINNVALNTPEKEEKEKKIPKEERVPDEEEIKKKEPEIEEVIAIYDPISKNFIENPTPEDRDRVRIAEEEIKNSMVKWSEEYKREDNNDLLIEKSPKSIERNSAKPNR